MSTEKQAIQSVRRNDIDGLKKCLRFGFCPNTKLRPLTKYDRPHSSNHYIDIGFKITLLHFACSMSIIKYTDKFNEIHEPPIEIIKYLIELGADVNKLDKNRCSPLHYACIMSFKLFDRNGIKDDRVVKLLVENGANVNIKTVDNYTPLFLVAMNCQGIYFDYVEKLIKYLIENGAKIRTGKKSKMNILPVLYCNLMPQSQKNVLDLIEYLIDSGANPNGRDEHGKTTLYYAEHFRNVDHIELLIKKDAEKAITN